MHASTFPLLALVLINSCNANDNEELESYCPDDWFDAGSLGCYMLLESAVDLTWVQAQDQCEQIGGYLAEPKTESHASLLEELVALESSIYGINYWYFGLTDLGREGEWIWQHSQEAVANAHWKKHRPVTTFGNNKDCGVMVFKDGAISWQDVSCTTMHVRHQPIAAVCEHRITPSKYQCPYNWTSFDKHCYKFFEDQVIWNDANQECLAQGGNLVSIHSAEEDQFVTKTLVKDEFDFFMGGYPTLTMEWIWSDGTDFVYNNDGGSMTGGDCIHYKAGEAGWSTHNCYEPSNFVCKL